MTTPTDAELGQMVNDLVHTGDISMLYRMEIADAITALRAERDHWKAEFDAAHLTGYDAAKAEMREALIAAESERDDAMTLFHAADKKMRALAAERDAALAGAVHVKPLEWTDGGIACATGPHIQIGGFSLSRDNIPAFEEARAARIRAALEPDHERLAAMLEAVRREAGDKVRAWLDAGDWHKTEGPYSHKNNQCQHGKFGYEGCEECLIGGLLDLLDALAASLPTPTAVDGENSGETVGNEALHRSFPDAGDGRPMPPMGDELMIAGLSEVDARFVAVQLARNGLTLRDWRETAIVAMELAHRDYMTGKGRDPDKYTSKFSLAAEALRSGETVGKGDA